LRCGFQSAIGEVKVDPGEIEVNDCDAGVLAEINDCSIRRAASMALSRQVI